MIICMYVWDSLSVMLYQLSPSQL